MKAEFSVKNSQVFPNGRTMRNPDILSSWLKIALAASLVGDGNGLKLEVRFENQSDRPQKLLFSNRSRKAELLSLRVMDELGNLLPPERRDVILPKSHVIDEHTIPPQGNWPYHFLNIRLIR